MSTQSESEHIPKANTLLVRKRTRSFLGPFPEHFLPWSFQNRALLSDTDTHTSLLSSHPHPRTTLPSIVRCVDRGHVLLSGGWVARAPAPTSPPLRPPRRSIRFNYLTKKAKKVVRDAAPDITIYGGASPPFVRLWFLPLAPKFYFFQSHHHNAKAADIAALRAAARADLKAAGGVKEVRAARAVEVAKAKADAKAEVKVK